MLSVSVPESIKGTFYALRSNKPNAIFNKLEPTVEQSFQPLSTVALADKRLVSMLEEPCLVFPPVFSDR
jgi:hypothetical protein